jgi:hypothetical protein
MEVLEILQSWNISNEAISSLSLRPNLVRHLEEVRSQPPFPIGYQPQCHELLYEDLVYVRIAVGSTPYLRSSLNDYRPAFWEVALDGQLGIFVMGNEVIVDRTVNLDPQVFKTHLFKLAGLQKCQEFPSGVAHV